MSGRGGFWRREEWASAPTITPLRQGDPGFAVKAGFVAHQTHVNESTLNTLCHFWPSISLSPRPPRPASPHVRSLLSFALSQFRVFWCRVSLSGQNRSCSPWAGLEENEIELEEGSSQDTRRYVRSPVARKRETPFITSTEVERASLSLPEILAFG